jgi:ribosomal protein L11 methyltransferase
MTDGAIKRRGVYNEAVFEVHSAMVDEAAGLLIAWGAMGCAVNNVSRTGRPRGRMASLQAWYASISPRSLAQIHRRLVNMGLSVAHSAPTLTRRADPGWATTWMDRFEPLPIGRRLLIVPPWKTQVQAADRIQLVLHPGQGFGTGHHPTTAGALRAIEQVCDGSEVEEALDVGTGSGILAIAMRLFGARRVTAIDTDRAAVANARENVALNRVSGIRISSRSLSSLTGRFDLVTANILSSTLISMAPTLTRLLAPRGRLILGGILARERDEVSHHYRPGLRPVKSWTARGWVTIVMER